MNFTMLGAGLICGDLLFRLTTEEESVKRNFLVIVGIALIVVSYFFGK